MSIKLASYIVGAWIVVLFSLPFHIASAEMRDSHLTHSCKSHEVGIVFACDPLWKLSREPKKLTIIISEQPMVNVVIEELEQSVHYMSELSRDALNSTGRYADGFHIERFRHCDRETVKVNGFLKGYPNVRVSDFYLQDHLHLHSVKFTLDPKESWDKFQWIIKDIVDSINFVNHKVPITFIVNEISETEETCADLVP